MTSLSPWYLTFIFFLIIITLTFGFGLCVLALALKGEIDRWIEKRRIAKHQLTLRVRHVDKGYPTERWK